MTTQEIMNEIDKIYESEGKLPTLDRMSKLTGDSVEKVKKIYKHYLAINRDRISNRISPKMKPKTKSDVKKTKIDDYFFIRIIMGVVGVILMVCSVHFTYDFNKLAMCKFWSFMLSLAMILFTSLAFTVATIMGGKTSKVIYALWVIGVIYSIFTAVAGQYNDFRKYTSEDNSMRVEGVGVLLRDKLDDLEQKRDKLIHWRDEEILYTENPDLKLENPSTWKQVKDGVIKLEQVESEISDIQDKLIDNVEINVDANKTVYHWLSMILHIPSDIIQFLIIIFPSVFLDLCSGICLKFAFIKRKNL